MRENLYKVAFEVKGKAYYMVSAKNKIEAQKLVDKEVRLGDTFRLRPYPSFASADCYGEVTRIEKKLETYRLKGVK